ncbi:Isotocin-neurophysin IT 2 [Clarias magur]|uniref:Isotocin-neurophysin IT 2 n=1 Tax=Clarias magur TaxID=1594786 RepID=A0A8J4UKS8_CLAMG|nr:Isotocin-neurophysin IT 2 [Clarias magur]
MRPRRPHLDPEINDSQDMGVWVKSKMKIHCFNKNSLREGREKLEHHVTEDVF